jgi:hypothetical protein
MVAAFVESSWPASLEALVKVSFHYLNAYGRQKTPSQRSGVCT